MATSILQFSEADCPIGATNIAITNALVASDLLVLVTSTGQGGGRTQTITGFGTWSQSGNLQGDLTGPRVDVATLTGVTGTGNVTVTMTGDSARATLYVVRGLVSPVIYLRTIATSGGVAGVTYSPCPSARFTADQVLINVAATQNSGTVTFPDTGTLTSIGAWTNDGTVGVTRTNYAAHILGSASATTDYKTTVTRATGSAFVFAGLTLVLGTPAAGSATLEQDYVEAMTQTPSNLSLQQLYGESLLVGTPALAVQQEYIEVLGAVANVAHVLQEYVEVLSVVNLNRRGWGILA